MRWPQRPLEVDPVNRALRAAAIGVLFLGPVTLSACSAGQVNQTALQVRDKVGTTVKIGNLTLRQVELAYPKSGRYGVGDEAVLNMAIANEGGQADTLTSISGPGFQGVRVTGTGSQATASLGPTAALPQPTTATGSSTAANSSVAAGSSSAALPSEAPSSDTSIRIPSDTAVFLGQNAPHVTLVGLTRAVTPAQSLAITFTFKNAGSVTVRAIVANPSTVLPTPSPYDFESNSEGNVPNNNAGSGNNGG
jgi:copper(I)-binding protein